MTAMLQDAPSHEFTINPAEIEQLMSCKEGVLFAQTLSQALNAKHEGASSTGRKTAFYSERKAVATIASDLSRVANAAQASSDLLRDAIAKAAENNAQVLKSTFAVVNSAIESGFCANDGFFAWFAKNRPLISQSLLRNKWTAEALLEGTYERMLFGTVVPSGKKPWESRVRAIVTDSRNAGCQRMLEEFIATSPPLALPGSVVFFERFSESVGFSPESYAELSVATFDAQLRWFSSIEGKSVRRDAISQLKRFYVFAISKLPEGQRAFTFETGLTKDAILFRQLAVRWLEGYRAVTFSPADPPPAFPKWLLFPNKAETRHSSYVTGKPMAVDVSVHEDFQSVLISWLWTNGESAQALRFAGPTCAELIGNIVAAGSRQDGKWNVTSSVLIDTIAPHSALRPKQVRRVKGRLRSFLEYAEAFGTVAVAPACWLLLETTRAERIDEAGKEEALSREETASLAKALEGKIDTSPADKLAYIVFCTQALTPLRAGEIVTLKVSDIVPGSHAGHHVVERATKADVGGTRRIEIPRKIYELLMAARDETGALRDECPPEIGEYLFLVKGSMGIISPLSADSYRDKILSAGKSCGIERCTPSRLRKRYMTETVEQGLKHNLSRLVVTRLTNHACEETVNKYYLREDIREYLEATHGIVIGTPRIQGAITEDNALARFSREDEVEHGCGYCRNEDCNVAGTSTCLMCAGFLTSPQFIPQMEESLAILQSQIARAPSDHDRQHLVAFKKLLLGYLGKLLEIKEASDE